MCAKNATPPPATPNPPMKNGKRFWKINQNGKKNFAGMCIILQKNPNMTNVITLACGNITKYAPKIPAIAPDAPTAGIPLPVSP